MYKENKKRWHFKNFTPCPTLRSSGVNACKLIRRNSMCPSPQNNKIYTQIFLRNKRFWQTYSFPEDLALAYVMTKAWNFVCKSYTVWAKGYRDVIDVPLRKGFVLGIKSLTWSLFAYRIALLKWRRSILEENWYQTLRFGSQTEFNLELQEEI